MERGTRGRRLLVWDAPNMDMCLSEVIGERPTASTRPDLEAVLGWMRGRCQPEDQLEACVFINVPPGFESAMGAWVVGLRHAGYAVFAKPKRSQRDDVDADIIGHVERRFTRGSLVELVVASHDAKAFAGPLRRYAKAGVAVMVLGYREKDTFAAVSPDLIFVDLEDVSGVFDRPLPRTNLFDLPPGGRWFEPFARGGPDTPNRPPRDGARGAGGAAATTAAAGPARQQAAPGQVGDAAEGDVGAERPDEPPDDDAGPPPGRDEVISLLAAEVEAAVLGGEAGLTLREAGDLLRTRFPGHSLDDLGFGSFTGLVDALLEETSLVLVRRPGTGSVITPANPSDPPATSARVDPDAARPWAVEPGAGLALVTTSGPSRPALQAASGTASADTPTPSTLNPIYQAFGVREAAARRTR